MLTRSSEYHQTNFFGSDLLLQLDPKDALIQLATVIPWEDFDEAFSKHERQTGHALHNECILKHPDEIPERG